VLLHKSCFHLLLYDTDISQGNVVSHLRRDGIFSDSIIANFLLILTVKKVGTSIFDEVIRRTKMCQISWVTLYMYRSKRQLSDKCPSTVRSRSDRSCCSGRYPPHSRTCSIADCRHLATQSGISSCL